MTYRFCYLGDGDDPNFQLYGGNWNGNLPRRMGPLWPPMRRAPNELLRDWSEASGLPLVQLDYGAWCVPADLKAVSSFMEYVFGQDPSYRDPEHWLIWEGKPYLLEQLKELQLFLDENSDFPSFLIVAAEI